MNQYEKFINGEKLRGVVATSDAPRLGFKTTAIISSLILFFFMPLFFKIQIKGFLIWIAIGSIIIISVLARSPQRVHYVLSDKRLIKLDERLSSIRWAVTLGQIRQLRVVKKDLYIHIPKKTYIVYNISHEKKFLESLIMAKREAAP